MRLLRLVLALALLSGSAGAAAPRVPLVPASRFGTFTNTKAWIPPQVTAGVGPFAPFKDRTLGYLPASNLVILSPQRLVQPETSKTELALDPERSLSWAPAESQGRAEAAAAGLPGTYARLQELAAVKHGLGFDGRVALRDSRPMVSERTPIGLPTAGKPAWLANNDFRSNAQRSLAFALSRGVLKVKGSGADRRALAGGAKRMEQAVEIGSNPMGEGNAYTWRMLYGLPYNDARNEFSNLLRAHELYERALGRGAPFPIPVELSRVKTIPVNGVEYPIARVWSDPRLWPSQRAMLEHVPGIMQLAIALGGKNAQNQIAQLNSALMKAPQLGRAYLAHAGINADELPDQWIGAMALTHRASQIVLEHDPLGQLAVIERAAARNVLPLEDPDPAREETRLIVGPWLEQVDAIVSSYGEPLERRKSVEETISANRPGFERVLLAASREAGDSFGFLAGIGAKFEGSMTGKDMIGGQPTDFLDLGLPGPETNSFNPVAAKADFWMPPLLGPDGLMHLLFPVVEDQNAKDHLSLAGRAEFLKSARKSFKAAVEELLIGAKADGILTPGYRRSLLLWMSRQLDKPDAADMPAGEMVFRRSFLPVLAELREAHPGSPLGAAAPQRPAWGPNVKGMMDMRMIVRAGKGDGDPYALKRVKSGGDQLLLVVPFGPRRQRLAEQGKQDPDMTSLLQGISLSGFDRTHELMDGGKLYVWLKAPNEPLEQVAGRLGALLTTHIITRAAVPPALYDALERVASQP